MADTPENKAEGAAPEQAQQPQVKMKVLAQYIRDLSFENILVQKGAQGDVQPEVKVGVNLDARKRNAENQYEVITKLNVTATSKSDQTTLFVIELEYAGIFHVEGLPNEQLHPYLMIECPRITFPFVRRLVSDISRDGGFPPVNLEMIDFVALYRNEIARRVQEQKEGQPTN
ncbi:MAG: protein-export chaperone SecB [Marivivens sp.]|jgi:preprotein translocase subunit SecB|nr:protein-export chaperone SecB [Marivivens sp.]